MLLIVCGVIILAMAAFRKKGLKLTSEAAGE